MVTSKLDTLNALLYGLPDTLIKRLQLIQNHAAKLLTRKKTYDHVTPHLIGLHWLPVETRIRYKILLLAYKCLHGQAPKYLSGLLQVNVPPEDAAETRSSSELRLVEKRSRLKWYGDRAFSVVAPRL